MADLKYLLFGNMYYFAFFKKIYILINQVMNFVCVCVAHMYSQRIVCKI